MALRRVITRSVSKTNPHQKISQIPSSTHTIRNKKKAKTEMIQSDHLDEMFSLLEDDPLGSPLYSGDDFQSDCFKSQPTGSSQPADAGLTFDPELLSVCDSTPSYDNWKYSGDDIGSQPGTQLDMVNGIDAVMDYPSALLSPPASVAPVSSPAQLTTAEELLQFYLSPEPPQSPSSDYEDSGAHISDEDLLNDLSSILSSYEPVEQDGTLDSIRIEYNPPADTVALALSSQYEEGFVVFEDTSQSSADGDDVVPVVAVAPTAGPSRRGKVMATKSSQPPSKRGRKRKVSSDSDASDNRKKKQNAEAAKNYRKRKADQMSKVFEEKEEVEKKLEVARKKLQGKLNERNILLKMLYESYKENGDAAAPHKILFPSWIETWYQKQKDD